MPLQVDTLCLGILDVILTCSSTFLIERGLLSYLESNGRVRYLPCHEVTLFQVYPIYGAI